MADSHQYTLRRNDYSLDEQQLAVQETFADFFTRLSPSSVVRAAEPTGFDKALWQKAQATGVVTMGVPESRGGDGATLVDLVLVSEECGKTLAPIPFVEAAVAALLLADLDGAVAEELLAQVLEGSSTGTVALHPVENRCHQLVPAGAVADLVLALDGDQLVVIRRLGEIPTEPNVAGAPVGRWDLRAEDRTVLAEGREATRAYSRAERLWKLLTAGALAGSASSAVRLGVEFASSRVAFGQFIGTFQAISHSLVDAATLAEASRNLVRKAAWFEEYEPESAQPLVSMAFVAASRAAVKASTVGTHVQGGFGFTNESDMTLHFRRAKGWPLLAQRPIEDLLTIAESLPATPHI
ncbi:acyl-CoA dehydrogenase [Rhodococcus qingshengii]|uniref:acyl-CoA dehydrogenase n=1 Tax=Rhodococcus qingshengii TaxID=334542 RepID=UPI001BE5BEC8|nr:acyl-CoA dehydrogenase [Rhodococcus qingshengii]MBT2275327.1 acyl-CoA dehydrogenase family protein [Rhodococcus qingshengii]